MPWSRDQLRTALAVTHNWKPTGSARGFTRGFSKQVIAEGVKGGKTGRKKKRR